MKVIVGSYLICFFVVLVSVVPGVAYVAEYIHLNLLPPLIGMGVPLHLNSCGGSPTAPIIVF